MDHFQYFGVIMMIAFVGGRINNRLDKIIDLLAGEDEFYDKNESVEGEEFDGD